VKSRHLEWIAHESEAFVAAISPDALDHTVPSCPEWQLRDLVAHLGRVQRFWAGVVRAGGDERPDFERPDPPLARDAPAALVEWMAASTRELLDVLADTPPDAPAWTWWKESRNAGAIARHQAQEAAVHRWDAQTATRDPEPLARELADDGVDEFVWIARQLRPPARITLVCTDSGRAIPVASVPSVVTVSATASSLVLLLYGRVGLEAVDVEGDRAEIERFLAPI
jgi:uncharacterized protein (TIGR03083 family)